MAIKRGYTKDHLLSEIAVAFDKGDGLEWTGAVLVREDLHLQHVRRS